MKTKLIYLLLLDLLVISCSPNVEMTDMKDVIPLPADSLQTFLGISRKDGLNKILSYGAYITENSKTTYDFDIYGNRSFEHYLQDCIILSGGKKDITTSVDYEISFGGYVEDWDDYIAAQQEAQKTGKTIIPYDDVIKYVISLGTNYQFKSGKEVRFINGVIKNDKREELFNTENFDDFINYVNESRPARFECSWESDDVNSDGNIGCYMSVFWTKDFLGPLKISMSEYK